MIFMKSIYKGVIMAGNMGGAYNQDEQDKLDGYLQKRDLMINELFKEGKAPESPREMRLANELITAAEGSIHTNVANRIKHNSEENNAKTKMMVLEIIKNTRSSAPKVIDATPKEISDDYIPTLVVPGHTDYNPGPLDVKDFDPNKVGDNDDN